MGVTLFQSLTVEMWSHATYIKKAWLQITPTAAGQLMAFEIEARSIRSQENCPCIKEGPSSY